MSTAMVPPAVTELPAAGDPITIPWARAEAATPRETKRDVNFMIEKKYKKKKRICDE